MPAGSGQQELSRPVQLGLQLLEALHWHVLHKCEHLLLRVLVLVALAAHPDANTPGNVANAVAPDELVQLGVDSYIFREHGLHGKYADRADGLRSTPLELNPVDALVHVDRVVAVTGSMALRPEDFAPLAMLPRRKEAGPEQALRFGPDDCLEPK
eukprot:CAMPEP_0197869692 /NCGR_PEP_ID=MMETSP1439-20131203/518_1 /TAXON_ID=66791 /ORGANISM="Gonyaulax spinifera, Strain CCMP409" /LENGTH=154 /DNA_ID=CAMNT_0043488535 /DNA_START=118 /DNA_END=581 /DNA_ORIENTATION=+